MQENTTSTFSPLSIIKEKNLGVTVCSWVSSLLRQSVFWGVQHFSIVLSRYMMVEATGTTKLNPI